MRWTLEDDNRLKALYAEHPKSEVARRMGRSQPAVANRIQKLGLKKPGNTGCYKPGHSTWSRGMKGLDIGGKATRFKPGRRPEEARNYRPIGSVRITRDGYLERKVSDDQSVYPARRFVAIHRLIWEAANGPVPTGYIVVFKPGRHTTNEAEITLDRIECISRNDNMTRNSVHRLPKPLAEVAQLKGALTRQINKRSQARS